MLRALHSDIGRNHSACVLTWSNQPPCPVQVPHHDDPRPSLRKMDPEIHSNIVMVILQHMYVTCS